MTGAAGDAAGGSAGQSAEDLFSQGLDHHDRQEYDEAIRCYERAIELEPRMVVAHNNLGMVYIDKGLFEEAAAALMRTLALDEHYAEAYNNLGFVYRRTGDEPRAAAFYESFLTLETDVEDAPKIRGWLENVRASAGTLPDVKELISEFARAEDRPDSAAAKASPAAPGGPAEPVEPVRPAEPVEPPEPDITGATEMPSLLAKALESRRDDTGSAGQQASVGSEASVADLGRREEDIYDAKTVMKPPPDEAQDVFDAAQAALDAVSGGSPAGAPPRQPPPAARQAPAAPAAAPQAPASESPEALCERGLSQFEKGDLQGAEQSLRRAIATNPRLPVARSTLGRVLAKAERYDEAATELRQAVELDPTDAAGSYVLGFALRKLGQNGAAADAYERYLELTPDAAEGAQILGWIAEVRAAPQQVTPLELFNQAFRHYQDGELDQALDECEEVLAADETNGPATLLLGRILIDRGDLIRAVPALKRAEPLQPQDSEVHFYLGQAYEKRGLPDEAGAAYQRCLDLSPDGPHAEYARNWLEKGHRAQAAAQAATTRCGYCFRPFRPEELSAYEGKRICSDCMANLNIAPAQPAAMPAPGVAALERATAAEAVKTDRRAQKERIGRYLLLASLSVFAVLALSLLILIRGWLAGPLEKIGVYGALEAIGLKGSLEGVGVRWPGPEVPDDGKIPGVDVTGKTGEDDRRPPEIGPLVLSVERKSLGALPLVEFETRVEASGGKGGYVHVLLDPPPGMKIDEATGAITWTPGPVGGRFDFPRPVPVKVKVSSAEESKTVGFEVVVNFEFELGPVIDAGVRPGDMVRLAVGKLNVGELRDGKPSVTGKKARDDIALAWGSYREGWLRVLYGEGAAEHLSPGPQIDLGGVPSALVLADVTSDGRTDVVAANWARSHLVVFRQDDERSLRAEPPIPTGRGVDFLAAGDVDGDGDVDIAASHRTEPELHVYLQEVEGDEPGDKVGRLQAPRSYETVGRSGWNRVFVGPLAQAGGGGPRAVYLLRGSGGGSLFNVFQSKPDGTLHSYTESRLKEMPERLISSLREAMPVRLGERPPPSDELRTAALSVSKVPPHIAALVGGESPVLYVIGVRGEKLELLFRQEIFRQGTEGAREPIGEPLGMAVGDLNGDSVDDIVVLCAEEIHVLLGSSAKGEPFARAASVEVPLAVGPVAVGEFTRDDLPDLAVVLDDGKLQIVVAVHTAVDVRAKRGGEGE